MVTKYRLPQVNLKVPQVSMKLPQVKVKVPQVNAKVPQESVKLPHAAHNLNDKCRIFFKNPYLIGTFLFTRPK